MAAPGSAFVLRPFSSQRFGDFSKTLTHIFFYISKSFFFQRPVAHRAAGWSVAGISSSHIYPRTFLYWAAGLCAALALPTKRAVNEKLTSRENKVMRNNRAKSLSFAHGERRGAARLCTGANLVVRERHCNEIYIYTHTHVVFFLEFVCTCAKCQGFVLRTLSFPLPLLVAHVIIISERKTCLTVTLTLQLNVYYCCK